MNKTSRKIAWYFENSESFVIKNTEIIVTHTSTDLLIKNTVIMSKLIDGTKRIYLDNIINCPFRELIKSRLIVIPGINNFSKVKSGFKINNKIYSNGIIEL